MSKNASVAQLLSSIADLLEATGENRFKVQAYRVAAQSVDALDEDIEAVHRQGRLREVPGVGEHIAEKIDQFLRTGSLDYYDKLKKGAPREFEKLVQIEGLGPKRVLALHRALGIGTLKDLEDAAVSGKLAKVAGFGAKSQARVLEGLGKVESGDRIAYVEARKQAEALVKALRKHAGVLRIELAGSLRRKRKTIGDLDLLAAVTDAKGVGTFFSKLPQVASVIASGPTKVSVRLKSGRQADLRMVKPEQFGAAWLYFTGSKAHNIELRKIAQGRGWKLNEYGLFDKKGGVVARESEEEIYPALGFAWIPPEKREQAGWMEKFLLPRQAISPTSSSSRSSRVTKPA